MDRGKTAWILNVATAGLVLVACASATARERQARGHEALAHETQAAPEQNAPETTAGPSNNPEALAIEASTFSANPDPAAEHLLLIKVETLLDREHFSPGEIDGNSGSNLENAIAAFRQTHHLPGGAGVDATLFKSLTSGHSAPITEDYVITAEDEKGPFIGTVPTDFKEMATLKYLGYANPLQSLAEKFHMSQALLRELNPHADFGSAGTTIAVVHPGDGDLGQSVARVEVDKSIDQVRALDASGNIVAVFPATVGSTERPAPSGEFAVKAVATNPTYSYDPKRLTFGDKSMGALKIAPGPNNPVGTTWIDLTVKTYGIHGAPDPKLIGKTASHGCVRLTNWDAAALGRAVKAGTPVVFVGSEAKSASSSGESLAHHFGRHRSRRSRA